MKFVSWNVNGLRACMQKGFIKAVNELRPDFMCIQETKMQEGQAEVPLEGYHKYFNSAEKKGYSGTAVFTSHLPDSVIYDGMGIEEHSHEGRMITLVDSIFDVDTICALRERVGDLARKTYKENEEDDISIRLITDHIRSVTFIPMKQADTAGGHTASMRERIMRDGALIILSFQTGSATVSYLRISFRILPAAIIVR